jgi:hypothetical protein
MCAITTLLKVSFCNLYIDAHNFDYFGHVQMNVSLFYQKTK